MQARSLIASSTPHPGYPGVRADFDINCAVSAVQVATWARGCIQGTGAVRLAFALRLHGRVGQLPGDACFAACRRATAAEGGRSAGRHRSAALGQYASLNGNTVLARNAADFEHFHNPKAERSVVFHQRGRSLATSAQSPTGSISSDEEAGPGIPEVTFILLGGISAWT